MTLGLEQWMQRSDYLITTTTDAGVGAPFPSDWTYDELVEYETFVSNHSSSWSWSVVLVHIARKIGEQ